MPFHKIFASHETIPLIFKHSGGQKCASSSLPSPFGRRFCLGTSSLSFRLHALLKASLGTFCYCYRILRTEQRPLVRLCSLACRPRLQYTTVGGHNKTWHKSAIVESKYYSIVKVDCKLLKPMKVQWTMKFYSLPKGRPTLIF